MRLIVWVIMSMAALTFCTTRALASDRVEKGEEDKRSTISVSLSLEQTEDANIDSTKASIGYMELSTNMEWQFLLLDIDQREHKWENNDSFDGDAGGNPWETLTRIAPGIQYSHKFGEKWGLWPKLVVISGFEDEISSKSWTYRDCQNIVPIA